MINIIRRLPCQIALGTLVLYAATSGHGVTINSLSLTAKVAGWDWAPMLGQPLFWLLTLPLRLLPAAWVPSGLNFFFAAVAALTLGLLARTVELMTWRQPLQNENRWVRTLPVLLACFLCGLEFNFWQEATAASGEMLAFLPLASVIWLMLEYRVHLKLRWLDAAAIMWGIGMAENWLMQLALPAFVAGAFWLKVNSLVTKANRMEAPLFVTAEFWLERFYSLRFVLLKFLGRMAGFGFAGFLLIYAVLPLANSLNPNLPASHGQAWLVSLKQTKNIVVPLYYEFWVAHRFLLLTVALYFLVPILSCLMRQHEADSDGKPRFNPLADQRGRKMSEEIFCGIMQRTAGSGIDVWFYRSLRAALLLLCLWLAFDPTTGLRQIMLHQLNLSMPLLAFDYLNALGAAFIVSSFLLAAHQDAARPLPVGIPWRHFLARIPWRRLSVPVVIAGVILITAGLAARNGPAIFNANFHPLQRFGELAVESLPAGRGVILSDQPQKLAVFQAALSQHPNAQDWLAVDTHLLPIVEYRAALERRQPGGWLTDENRHELNPVETVRLLEQIAQASRLFFLHPSAGVLFERFYQEPAGAIYELKLRDNNSVETFPLPNSLTEANETFWTAAWQKELAPLVAVPSGPPAGWQQKIQRLGYAPAARFQDSLLAEWYSLSLDSWGVALQQQGRLTEAGRRFEQALQLNTNNFSAQISLACNTNLQSGVKQGLADVGKVAEQLGNFRRLSLVMNNSGPFDEPVFCYLLGEWYQQNGLLRQAVEQFERTRILAPGVTAPEFALAKLYARFQLNDRVRQLINHIHEETKNVPTDGAMDLEMALMEADSWLLQTNTANASSALQSVVQQHPDDEQIANRVISAYLAFGDYTSAGRLVKTQLAKTPDDVHILNSQAAILLKTGNAAAAIPVLDHVLTLTNLVAARLNRANAQITCQNFAAAETDYRELEQSGVEPGRVNYGLATIADQRHDTNQAVRYFQASLTTLPQGTFLWRQASARLQSLEPNPSHVQ